MFDEIEKVFGNLGHIWWHLFSIELPHRHFEQVHKQGRHFVMNSHSSRILQLWEVKMLRHLQSIRANSEGPMGKFYSQIIAPKLQAVFVGYKICWICHQLPYLFLTVILWFLQFLDWQLLINNSKPTLMGPSQLLRIYFT